MGLVARAGEDLHQHDVGGDELPALLEQPIDAPIRPAPGRAQEPIAPGATE